MNLSNLKPATGSTKVSKRIGRGQGSGKGGTSTKGHKGQQARTGYSKKVGFEGGQMPLYRRLPKFGFTNPFRVEYKPINLDVIQDLVEKKSLNTINPEVLYQNGLISKNDIIKILGRGELKSTVSITAHKFSEAAVTLIEKAGGIVTILSK